MLSLFNSVFERCQDPPDIVKMALQQLKATPEITGKHSVNFLYQNFEDSYQIMSSSSLHLNKLHNIS